MNWKGGRSKKSDGYILRTIRTHPYADKFGRVYEHRFIMEQSLGRYLTKDEQIHHINEIRDDNRIENLKLMSRTEHLKFHFGNKDYSDRVCIICDSTKSYIHKQRGFPCWYSHPITKDKWLCSNCYQRTRKAMKK